MKLIVDIDENDYKHILDMAGKGVLFLDLTRIMKNSIINATPIPDHATNGDAIKVMFPKIDASITGDGDVIDVYNMGIYCQTFDLEWWNAPYNKESD